MPSYRYLKDIDPDSLRPKAPPEYTKKQRAANWWRYHWGWAAAGLACAAALVFFVLDMADSKPPDLSIGIVAPYLLPDALLLRLQTELALVTEDLNGDGEVVVSVSQYTVSAPGAEDAGGAMDPALQMAGVTRLAGAFEAGDPMIFIADAASADLYQSAYGLFAPPDGSLPAAGAGAQSYTVEFSEITVLAELDLRVEAAIGGMADGHLLLDEYRVGVRPLLGTKHESKPKAAERWRAAWRFLGVA
jgi:hypothetical protein